MPTSTPSLSVVPFVAGTLRWPPFVRLPGGGIKLGSIIVKPPVSARPIKPGQNGRKSRASAPGNTYSMGDFWILRLQLRTLGIQPNAGRPVSYDHCFSVG
jgi:hypothetical protein